MRLWRDDTINGGDGGDLNAGNGGDGEVTLTDGHGQDVLRGATGNNTNIAQDDAMRLRSGNPLESFTESPINGGEGNDVIASNTTFIADGGAGADHRRPL